MICSSMVGIFLQNGIAQCMQPKPKPEKNHRYLRINQLFFDHPSPIPSNFYQYPLRPASSAAA